MLGNGTKLFGNGCYVWKPEHNYAEKESYKNGMEELIEEYKEKEKALSQGTKGEVLEPLKKKKKNDEGVFVRIPGANILPTKVQPRKYQDELFQACKLENTIAVAPTGTGKTHISLLLINETLRKHPLKKIVFLVNQISLVMQQAKVIKSFLDQPFNMRVGEIFGDKSMDWKEATEKYDVLVVTSQMLYNALSLEKISLKEICLMVIDECHNIRSNHAARRIVRDFYLVSKRKGEQVPHLLGLSASPAANNSIGETLLRLIQLCHDMDSSVKKVEENEDELKQIMNAPEVKKVLVEMDAASAKLRKLIKYSIFRLKKGLADLISLTDEDSNSLLDKSQNPSSLQEEMVDGDVEDDLYGQNWNEQFYTDMLSKSKSTEFDRMSVQNEEITSAMELEEDIALIERVKHINDFKGNRIAMIANCISILINIDAINDERSSEAAWSKLKAFLETVEEDPEIYRIFESEGLTKYAFKEEELSHHCSKRKKLLEILLQYKNKTNFRCLIFVKSRVSATELKQMIENSPEHKKFIRPDILFGKQSRQTRGMTAAKQKEVLNDFREGLKTNLVIATTVAEEGIDIPSCNLVIRLDGVSSALQLIQSKGRARTKESEFYCIFHSESSDIKRLNRCEIHEKKMYKSIDIVKKAQSEGIDVFFHRVNTKESYNTFIEANSDLDPNNFDTQFTLQHIWETVWNFPFPKEAVEDAVRDELLEKKIKEGQERNIFDHTIQKLLNVNPEYEYYKRREKPVSYHGVIKVKIGSYEMIFTAPEEAPNIQEAKRKAILFAINEFKKRDLLVIPNSTWTELFTTGNELDLPKVTKKKKKKELVDVLKVIDETNAVQLLTHYCKYEYEKDPVWNEVRFNVNKKDHWQVICSLPFHNPVITMKSDLKISIKDCKKNVALKICQQIGSMLGKFTVPKTMVQSILPTAPVTHKDGDEMAIEYEEDG